MENRSRAKRRYLREIRGWLPCSGKWKRGILEKIEQSMAQFLSENPEASYEALAERFGSPRQIAATYVDDMGTAELLKDLRARRRVVQIVAAAAVTVVCLWTGLITVSYIGHLKDIGGCVVVGEVAEIDRVEVEQGGN